MADKIDKPLNAVPVVTSDDINQIEALFAKMSNGEIKVVTKADLAGVVAAGVGSALGLSGLLGKKIGFFTKSTSEQVYILQYVSETERRSVSSGLVLAVSDTDYALISYIQNQIQQTVKVEKISGGLSIGPYNNVGTFGVSGATKYYIIPIYY